MIDSKGKRKWAIGGALLALSLVAFWLRTQADEVASDAVPRSVESAVHSLDVNEQLAATTALVADRIGSEDGVVDQPVETRRDVIVGVVVSGCGESVAGAYVFAIRQDTAPTQLEVAARTDVGTRLRFATVDESGGFGIHGVDEERDYLLTVVADGALARSVLGEVRAGREDVRLVLDCLYRSRVLVVDAIRGTLEIANSIYGARDFTLEMRGEVPFEDVTSRKLELALAAELAPKGEPEQRIFERFYLSPTSTGPSVIGTIRVDLPGYLPTERELWVHRALGAVPDQRVELEREGRPFGQLDVRVDLPESLRANAATGNLGRLSLTGEDGRGFSVGLGPSALTSAGETFRIPAGRYYAYFLAASGSLRFPAGEAPMSFTVAVEGEPTRVEIPLPDAGGLELALRDRSGRVYGGAAIVRLTRAESGRYRHCNFEGPPYVLSGIEPGEVTLGVMLVSEFVPPGAERWRGTVRVNASELQRVELSESDDE